MRALVNHLVINVAAAKVELAGLCRFVAEAHAEDKALGQALVGSDAEAGVGAPGPAVDKRALQVKAPAGGGRHGCAHDGRRHRVKAARDAVKAGKGKWKGAG